MRVVHFFAAAVSLLLGILQPLHATSHCLSICSLLENESEWLAEWIEYHVSVGVEHFLLYDCSGNGAWEEVLSTYLENNVVEVVDFSDAPLDRDAARCLVCQEGVERLRSQSQWVAFVNPDEFLVPMRGLSLKGMLLRYSRYSGLMLPTYRYGTSGVVNLLPSDLLTELLIEREEKASSVRCIVQPAYVCSVSAFDDFQFVSEFCPRIHRRRTLLGWIGPDELEDQFVCNYYHLRTIDWALNEKLSQIVGRVSPESETAKRGMRHLLLLDRESCMVEDLAIQRFLPMVRNQLNQMRGTIGRYPVKRRTRTVREKEWFGR